MQVAVISGGSSGIGLACVSKFLQNGYFVYNLDIEDNKIIFDNYVWLNTDVCSHEAVKKAIHDIINQQKKIDALVLSAGRHLSANIENTSDDQLDKLINLNIKGSYWLIQETVPHMRNRATGSIVILGSDQSSIAKPNSCVYAMTKSAVLGLTKSIAIDYAPYNIRVNCIGAGTIDTPLYRNAINRYCQNSGHNLAEVELEEGKCQPLGRIGKPEEIAELAYFLCQDAAAYITGALIPADGGYIAR